MTVADYAQARMTELLTAATTALEATRITNAPPTKIKRTHGAPVIPVQGCTGDILAVFLDSPAAKLSKGVEMRQKVNTARNAGPKMFLPELRLVVELWRCVPGLGPNGEEPLDADLDTSAANLATDMWALWTGLAQDIEAGTLFPTLIHFRPTLGDPLPRGPEGRMAGWRITVEVPVSDAGPPQ